MGGGGAGEVQKKKFAQRKIKIKNIHAMAPKQIRTKNSPPPPP